MAKYDPAKLTTMANRLYWKADTIIFLWIVAGLAVGGTVGYLGWPGVASRIEIDARTVEDTMVLVPVGAGLICGIPNSITA